MKIDNLLKNLKLDSIRNIIIYTSFIILVISIIANNQSTQKASSVFFIYGLFLWFLEHCVDVISLKTSKKDTSKLLFLWGLFAIIGFVMSFELAFGKDIIMLIFS